MLSGTGARISQIEKLVASTVEPSRSRITNQNPKIFGLFPQGKQSLNECGKKMGRLRLLDIEA